MGSNSDSLLAIHLTVPDPLQTGHILAGGGMLVAGLFVFKEATNTAAVAVCPHLGTISACYLAFGAFVLVLVSFLIQKRTISLSFFTVGSASGILIAIRFSYLFLNGKITNPPSLFGIPLCLASLATFSLIIILKAILLLRKNK